MTGWRMISMITMLGVLGCAAGPPRNVTDLLGEREYARSIDDLKKKLGISWLIGTPAFYGDSCDVWYHGRGEAVDHRHGLGLTFEGGRLTEVWYDQLDQTSCEGDASYAGTLPLRIYRGETRGGLLRRLGPPAARWHEMRSTWCQGTKTGTREFSLLKYYEGSRVVIAMFRDSDAAPVTRVIVTRQDLLFPRPDPALGLIPAQPAVAARCLVLHRQQKARAALAGGCRQGALYRGCYRANSRCLGFRVRTPERWETARVATDVSLKLMRFSNTAGTGEGVSDVTTVVLAECDGLPIGDGRDPCEVKDPLAECDAGPEFILK
jgi:hypothetical protein